MSAADATSVSEALYHATANPELGKNAVFSDGICGSCLQRTTVAAAARILTSTFGSWDSITADPQTGLRHLCLPCAWAYRHKPLQHHPTIITRGATTYTHPTGEQLRNALAGPIPGDTAILLPITGKKAVAPRARWGRLTIDSGPIEWTRPLARATQHVIALKRLGFTEPMLTNPAPAPSIFDALDIDTWIRAQSTWEALDPIRRDKTLFPVALKLSREKM